MTFKVSAFRTADPEQSIALVLIRGGKGQLVVIFSRGLFGLFT